MNKITLSLIAIWINGLGLLSLIIAQREIYLDFMDDSGKTQALFGLKELFTYGHVYYLALIGLGTLIVALIGLWKHEPTRPVWLAIMSSLVLIVAPFLSLWSIFV